MKAIRHHIHGSLFVEEGQTALLLKNASPDDKGIDSLYLRYAFTVKGTEERILPAFVLDDWGTEIKGLDLYQWVDEYGNQFPRAELFGFNLFGQEMQCFLRELELYSRLFCYAYPHHNTPLSEGVLLDTVWLPDDTVQQPTKIKRPASIRPPLPSIQASWWRVNPQVDRDQN